MEIEIEQEGSYIWRVYIKEIGKSCGEESQCFNIESGYFDFYLPQEINNDITDPEVVIDTPSQLKENTPITPPPQEEVLGVTTEYIPKEEYKPKKKDKEEEAVTEKTSERNYCRYIYNVKNSKFQFKECNIDLPKVSQSTYDKYNDQYIVNTQGTYQNSVKIYIDNIVCSDFDILHPSTWFKCEQNVIDTAQYTVDLDHEVYFFDKRVLSPSNYIFGKSNFEISSVLSSLPTNILDKGYFSVKHKGSWLDQELVYKEGVSFEKLEYKSSGIYSFPFKELIPVNQWHGCTVYQCPHCGIDFASVRHNIYASGNGKVVSVQYDSPYSECGNSGKTILIEQENGQYMSYMHLSQILVKNGRQVKRGNLIAVSGNSGQYNCQPLGNHLHFELRSGRYQPSHIDPVPFIDINWNLIVTNKASTFPGRLSGDNPHPNF